MKLKKLLKGVTPLKIKGSKEIEITGISANSKMVAPGNLFVAKKGLLFDGARFIPDAIDAGAAAIVSDFFDPTLKKVTQIIHPNVNAIEGLLGKNFYNDPGSSLFMVGITGTNGKTTTSFLIHHLLEKTKGKCGLIGTIEYIMGNTRYSAVRTTPDLFTNYKLLNEMRKEECSSAVMEVTSHALDQGRVAGISFDRALFTNLTLDHLDYHKTMENYVRAKNRLFRNLKGWAIVNGDSLWVDKVIEGCQAPILRYGIETEADLTASSISLTSSGTGFTATYQGKNVSFHTPLIGRYNIYNALSVIGLGLTMGFSLEALTEVVASFPPISGRLEPVPNDLGLKIFVDFAHSDDALQNVLETLTEFKTNRIITVFGCGGDRDVSKRPKMAEVSEKYSDLTIVTTDNPRSEDPEQIAREIVKGFHQKNHIVELDRKRAIRLSLEKAAQKDIVLIAGKGHEKMQVFAHETVEFDDCRVAKTLCQEKRCVSPL